MNRQLRRRARQKQPPTLSPRARQPHRAPTPVPAPLAGEGQGEGLSPPKCIRNPYENPPAKEPSAQSGLPTSATYAQSDSTTFTTASRSTIVHPCPSAFIR